MIKKNYDIKLSLDKAKIIKWNIIVIEKRVFLKNHILMHVKNLFVQDFAYKHSHIKKMMVIYIHCTTLFSLASGIKHLPLFRMFDDGKKFSFCSHALYRKAKIDPLYSHAINYEANMQFYIFNLIKSHNWTNLMFCFVLHKPIYFHFHQVSSYTSLYLLFFTYIASNKANQFISMKSDALNSIIAITFSWLICVWDIKNSSWGVRRSWMHIINIENNFSK